MQLSGICRLSCLWLCFEIMHKTLIERVNKVAEDVFWL